ncbi:unnamed protein product [Ectocarpus sp. CCAP 1310/34]|nr:unnamed protein product [Ectocarpus sp. CCAP 1310/34]
MTPEKVKEHKDRNWTYFLRNCRRLVPERERLLQRFNKVIEQFWDVIDSKSGEILLRPKAMDAIHLLRRHIEADCLIDPDDVALLLSTYCASPALAHSILLEFNHRWNIKMAVKNRNLPKEIGGCFDQFDIEIIQRETTSWDLDSPVFSERVSALDAADTGQRSGLAQSMCGGADAGDSGVDALGEQEMVQNAVPLPKITHSANEYARMMNVGMPECPCTME